MGVGARGAYSHLLRHYVHEMYNLCVTRICIHASYQFLGNPAGVKYPYKVVKQNVQRSFIVAAVPGLEKNNKDFFLNSQVKRSFACSIILA